MTKKLEKLANAIDALPMSTTCTLTINEPFTPPTEFEWDGDMMPTLKAMVADWRYLNTCRNAVNEYYDEQAKAGTPYKERMAVEEVWKESFTT